MLRADGLRVDPLPPLSFSVAKGECLAVEGPSGSGKTRLLRALADLDPSAGHVFLEGAERAEMRAPDWRRRVRYASSEPAWWTDTARTAFDTSAAASLERLQRLLAATGLTSEYLDKPLSSLSTGERQRLAFARAVIDDPAVLLLDEPTNGLDANSTAFVEDQIKVHLLAGCIVVLASHDQSQIDRLSHVRLQLARPLPMRRPSPR